MDKIPTEAERGLRTAEPEPLFLELVVLPSPNFLRAFVVVPEIIVPQPAGSVYEDAGRRGGAAVMEKYGNEFFSEIGKRGGEATSKKLGHDHYEKIGKKGGATMKRKAEAGEGLPREHYVAIGKKGGAIVREVFAERRRRKAEEGE